MNPFGDVEPLSHAASSPLDFDICVERNDVDGLVKLLKDQVTSGIQPPFLGKLESFLSVKQHVKARRPLWNALVASGWYRRASAEFLWIIYDDDRFVDPNTMAYDVRKSYRWSLFVQGAARCLTKCVQYHKDGETLLSYSDVLTSSTNLQAEQMAWSSLPSLVVTEEDLEELFGEMNGYASPRLFALSKRNRWALGRIENREYTKWNHVLLTAAYFAHELDGYGEGYTNWPDSERILSYVDTETHDCWGVDEVKTFDPSESQFCIAFMYFWGDPVAFVARQITNCAFYRYEQSTFLPGERIFLHLMLIEAGLLRIREEPKNSAKRFWKIASSLPREVANKLAMIASATFHGSRLITEFVAGHAYRREWCHWQAAQRLPKQTWSADKASKPTWSVDEASPIPAGEW